jgi:hypothetical protein
MPRTVADIDQQIRGLWETHRSAVDFWTRVDTLLDVRLTLMGRA